jgi:phage-related protein
MRVIFFRTESSREPVRDWLLELDKQDRKVIGEDIKLVQFRWPLGLPLVRKLEPHLWEVRSRLKGGRTARVCFTVQGGRDGLAAWLCQEGTKDPVA